jgi:hypothetical protein
MIHSIVGCGFYALYFRLYPWKLMERFTDDIIPARCAISCRQDRIQEVGEQPVGCGIWSRIGLDDR